MNREHEVSRRGVLLVLACIASVASFITTVQGTLSVFPDFGFSRWVGIGLAIVFQAVLLLVPLELGTRVHVPTRIALGIVGLLAWWLSTTSSFVCMHTAFTRDQFVADRGFRAWQISTQYLSEVQALTTQALDQVEAGLAEVRRKINQEIERGGSLLQFVNPHLANLADVEKRDAPFDKLIVVEGEGLRVDFLRDIETQLITQQKALQNSLEALARHSEELDSLQGAEPASLMSHLNQAGQFERRLLVTEVIGEEFPEIDAKVYEPIETSREWAVSIHQLFEFEFTAVGMALIAFTLDLFIVVLSWAAGVREPKGITTSLAQLFRNAYGPDYFQGARRWWDAVDGEMRYNSRSWYRIQLELLGDGRDFKAQEILEHGLVLRSLPSVRGEQVLVISEKHHRELGDLILGQVNVRPGIAALDHFSGRRPLGTELINQNREVS